MCRPSPYTGPVLAVVAVRDALGQVRNMWLEEKDRDFGDDETMRDHFYRMEALTEVGKTLRTCLQRRRTHPDSEIGRRTVLASWAAMDVLLKEFPTSLVRVAHGRVTRWRPREPDESTLKKMARMARG